MQGGSPGGLSEGGPIDAEKRAVRQIHATFVSFFDNGKLQPIIRFTGEICSTDVKLAAARDGAAREFDASRGCDVRSPHIVGNVHDAAGGYECIWKS